MLSECLFVSCFCFIFFKNITIYYSFKVLFLTYFVTFVQVQAVELDLSIKREGEGEGHSHNSGNLFDVIRGDECDSSYQREQRAVVDAHPGHSLTIHQIQDVERDQEMLFPQQPGQQG